MNQPGLTLLRLAVMSGLVALRAPASTILPPPTTLAHCVIDSTTLDGSTDCALTRPGGSALASVTLFPFVSLSAEATSAANDTGLHGAGATAILTYSFEVLGGSPGDIVPILIATSLSSVGTDVNLGIGFAILSVHTSAAGDSFVAVCTNATCGTTASSFSGTLSTRARSGDANILSLQVEASTGNGQSATASADPFIFIDPAFPGAGLYSIVVSDGVANGGITATPEPGALGLALAAAAFLTGLRRRAVSKQLVWTR